MTDASDLANDLVSPNPMSAMTAQARVMAANGSAGFAAIAVPTSPEAASKTPCLWCGRTFRPRKTGGSAQRFCSAGHRQAFWIAARRWTMRAVETGLLSVDCLKAVRASVHAGRGALRPE